MQEWVRGVSVVVIAFAVGMRVGERRIVDALEAKGAVDPGSATPLPLTNMVRKWHFRRLLNAGVVGETMAQLQYVKIVEYAAWSARRRRRALLLLAAVLVTALASYLASR